jgi:hypothetical protein
VLARGAVSPVHCDGACRRRNLSIGTGAASPWGEIPSPQGHDRHRRRSSPKWVMNRGNEGATLSSMGPVP